MAQLPHIYCAILFLVRYLNLDLTSLASVRDFATKFQESEKNLHILVNNAGIMISPYGQTKDGFELQLGINHLGHFALTLLLLDIIKR
jgi:NAD(P)-dependent dehydrogenase (short-subunit alcohol dehydrogenase family)